MDRWKLEQVGDQPWNPVAMISSGASFCSGKEAVVEKNKVSTTEGNEHDALSMECNASV